MGKTAIITGSARGIGAAIALRLAKDGFDIALNDISEKSFENNDIMERITALGVRCERYIADVSSHSECESFVKKVKEDFGTIDALVNNAGITRDGLLLRMAEENYDDVIRINQKSVFNMTKFVGAVMLRQKSGKIVNLASVAGLYGNPGQMNYSASKGAVIAMTKTAAKELGSRGINVNAVAPGFIKTPMTDKLTEEQRNAMLAQIAMKRYGEPEEVADVVAFLCSENAAYVTGQTIEISGGLSM
ncbi:MAG: 3-oxoacyl-[acyl-carrier-protein] reductase [Lachnospiraceae bacterium]|nr:3-oxoacyl-[acyl-carrier-protein] reductase [Ruminococcus sp.]MCM1274169.1 3-oxoacyl-[acyl-carrier-protein] reductase [Lachnospiraceae bacterium]